MSPRMPRDRPPPGMRRREWKRRLAAERGGAPRGDDMETIGRAFLVAMDPRAPDPAAMEHNVMSLCSIVGKACPDTTKASTMLMASAYALMRGAGASDLDALGTLSLDLQALAKSCSLPCEVTIDGKPPVERECLCPSCVAKLAAAKAAGGGETVH